MLLYKIHEKINSIVPIHGVSQSSEGEYVVSYISEPTEEQLEQVNAMLENIDVELARFDKLDEIEKEWKITVSQGWETPDGWRLGLDTQDVTLLTGLFILAKEALNMGLTDPVQVIDMNGESHPLSFSELTQLMLAYGSARSLLSSQYANRVKAAKEAQTLEELQEI